MYHKRSFMARYLKNCTTSFNQTWQGHVTVNAHCVMTTGMHKVKGQGRTRPEIWRPGGVIILDPFGSSGFSSLKKI